MATSSLVEVEVRLCVGARPASGPLGSVPRARGSTSAALQILDGTARRPGAHTQAMLVEPTRFFAEQAAMGLTVEWLADRGAR